MNTFSRACLFVFGLGGPDQTVATILEVILGVSENWGKKDWRITAGDEPFKKAGGGEG
jgi:hypothetical protein